MARPVGKRYKAPVFGKNSIQLTDVEVAQTDSRYTRLKIIEAHDPRHSASIQEGILLSTNEGELLLPQHGLFIVVAIAG